MPSIRTTLDRSILISSRPVCRTSIRRAQFSIPPKRAFTVTTSFNMPEPLSKSEITSETDPSVAKQYDHKTPISQQIEEFYKLTDGLKTCLMGTTRSSVGGQVSRSMATAKRVGPDFLFLANKHSNKFKDLDHSKAIQLTFQDSSSQNWASITGTATVASNDDPRIKDLVNPFVSAWFGDLGDGVHNGKAEDPRMALIEVKADYVTYWLSQTGTLGFFKEITQATLTGKVATTGITRELKKDDLEQARREAK